MPAATAPRTATIRRLLSKPPPWVVMYHSIADAAVDPYRVTVSPVRFARQLHWLTDRGLRGVSVRELLAATAAGRAKGLVGLTFDDGYADFLDSALPLLRRHGFTATVYVLPGRIGGENAWDGNGPRKSLLTEDGILRVLDAGMEIGSHGLRHVSLPSVDDRTLAEETGRSRVLLEEITGAPVDGFCYPYGDVDARAIQAVRDAGYGYGCAIAPGTLTCAHALPRVHIGEQDTSWRLTAKRILHPLRRSWPAEPVPARVRPAGAGVS
ncbi:MULTISPECIES: polysaccharide deacetylase family protein [Streptomyces]|uniref:polysaccharide deacetylase family protein n=1 Tax=Streptomyces TaxID=1883 RepID=UPI001315BD82|nr:MULTISPECIES: polysaccharide deacetylase family protein [Streptomyces]QGZ50673.1 polysaccharide deacetylase family protein [Streptomyces sp. QHH-9511]GGT83543.1 polysaccharide deacetylase [Streptomyces lateritius]